MFDWYLGTMGFSYKAWEGSFYPAGLVQRNYLAYYAQHFNAVEMDSTFYATPARSTVQRWEEVTPPDFVICPKLPRLITHELRLHDAEQPLEQFLATLRLLGAKLGPILLQFPPDYTFAERATLTTFLKLLPTDLRYAAEFRHRSWYRDDTAELLAEHNICLAAADYIYLPKVINRTTDFLYLRCLGPHGRFATKNREILDKGEELEEWWLQIAQQEGDAGRVYAFFNNDYAGFAPATCNRFKTIVGLEPGPTQPPQQLRLI